MLVVIVGLFVVFFAAAVVVSLVAGTSATQRQREKDRLEREEAKIKEAEAEQALLFVPGEPLICLGCQKRFLGPMPGDGCPDCQIASLVVPERARKQSV
jgi:hypothetical protein